MIEQVTAILLALDSIEDHYEDGDNKDEVPKAISKIAGLILSGGKAALLGAIAELLDLLDLDAEPEDVDVDQTADGGVYIYLKVKRTCFFVFDLDPDFIFYRKGGKAGTAFGRGQPAKDKYKKAKDKYKKITEGSGGGSGTGTGPGTGTTAETGSGTGGASPGSGIAPGAGDPAPTPAAPPAPVPPPPQPPSATEA